MIGKLQGNSALLLGAVGIFSLSLITGGYLLGDGLRRAKSAERSISVRGAQRLDIGNDPNVGEHVFRAHDFFSLWPPNCHRIADSTWLAKSARPRELNRS